MKTKPKQEQKQSQREYWQAILKEFMGSSTHFPTKDKLCEKSHYHRWKMSLDLRLEEQEVLDHVRGGIAEPPSNTSATPRNKWTKGELKAKKIIRDSIEKYLVAYISKLSTS